MLTTSFFRYYALVAVLVAHSNAIEGAGDYSLSKRDSTSLEDFISSESPIALQGVLANIGPDGALADEAKSGVVVASPTKSEPNCE